MPRSQLLKEQPKIPELDLQSVPFPASLEFSASSSKGSWSSVAAENGYLGRNRIGGTHSQEYNLI